MSAAVVAQVTGHEALSRRLVRPWQLIVVLERIARGAGATNWFLFRQTGELSNIVRKVRKVRRGQLRVVLLRTSA